MTSFMKKTHIKIVTFALAFVFVFSSAALAQGYFQGSGTEGFPFYISSAEELMTLSRIMWESYPGMEEYDKYNSSYYQLTHDIDMAEYSDDDWIPIGYGSNRVSHVDFNGNGHTISNLASIATDSYPRGFFGWFAGKVYDLTLENVNFQGNPVGTNSGMGGVAAVLYTNGVIDNVHVTGTLTTSTGGGTNPRNVGGIVGIVQGTNARISNCTFDGNIIGGTSGANDLGGIVGFVSQSGLVVEDCYSAGSIIRPGVGSGSIGKIAGSPRDATFVNDTTSMTIDAETYGGPEYWSGFDGTEVDPALLTKLGVVYNDGAVVVKNAKRLAVATLWFTAASGTPSYTGLNNFAVLDEATVGSQYRVTLGYLVSGGEGFTSENAGILKISGVSGVEIKNAKFVSYDENGNAIEVDSNVVKDTTGVNILPPGDDPTPVINYDLNGDGKVDQLDLAIALKYFTTTESAADFDGNGTVGIEDFILLLNHVTAW